MFDFEGKDRSCENKGDGVCQYKRYVTGKYSVNQPAHYTNVE